MKRNWEDGEERGLLAGDVKNRDHVATEKGEENKEGRSLCSDYPGERRKRQGYLPISRVRWPVGSSSVFRRGHP